MDLPPSKIEWHLVRDGKPYGPLSDLEFFKFIELGHLEPNDLLWRDGFKGWQSADVVFPELQELPTPFHTEPVEFLSKFSQPLVSDRPVERKTTSRKARVITLFLIVMVGGAASYAYFWSDYSLSETANFLTQLLAL
jgi:hypothetical protein